MTVILKHKLAIAGAICGAVAGYCYYFFIGCANGTCIISSNPVVSTAYGALVGALIFTSIKKTNKKKNNDTTTKKNVQHGPRN